MTFSIAWRSTSSRVSMTLSTSSAETGTTSAPRLGYSRSRPSDSSRTNASRTGVRLSRTPSATSASLMSAPPANRPSRIRRFVKAYARSVAVIMHLYRILDSRFHRWHTPR